MRNIIKFTLVVFTASLVITACFPDDDFKLGNINPISVDQVKFTYTASDKSDNIIIFTNTSDIQVLHSYIWDLGNGVITKEKNPIGMYPTAGNFTVSLSVSTSDGNTVIKSQVINIEKDDPTLFDTPTFRALTGGPDNTEGKTWIFDKYNTYTQRVANAVKKDIRGHMGLGELNSYSQQWWGAGPNEKSMWKMYDMTFNFNQSTGLALNITTEGFGYGRKASSATTGGFTVIEESGEDVIFNYNGGNYSFFLNEFTAYPTLTLSGNAFMGYYCGTQYYEIIYIDDEVLALCAHNSNEGQGQDWVFIYHREDLKKDLTIPEDKVTFEMTQGSNEFTYNYTVTVDVDPNDIPYTVIIEFGEGETTTELSGIHNYIVYSGTYIARCTVSAGNSVVKEVEIVIENDNPAYDPESNLSGNGKSWKLRPQSGGIILRPVNESQVWWTIDNGTDGAYAAFDDVLTFYGNGKAKLENNGNSFMNESTADLFSDGNPDGSFVTEEYIPSNNATWSIVKIDGVNYLKLSNVFPMYAVNPDLIEEGFYKIIALSANLLQIKFETGTGDWDAAWTFYLVPVE